MLFLIMTHFGRDMVYNGDIVEIARDVYVTNPHDF